LSAANFVGTSNNDVSVWLRARNQGDDVPNINRAGSTYFLRPDDGGSGDAFSFEFQFTPEAGATTTNEANNEYFLELALDNDPSSAVSYADNTLTAKVFDDDSDDELLDSGRGDLPDGSWDDGDSVVIDGITERGGNTVDFQATSGTPDPLPEFVVVNSWLARWNFSNFSLLGDDFGGAPGPGQYNIRLTAFNDDNGSVGSELASVEITAQVVPTPSAVLGGMMLLGGLALRRRFRAA